MNKFVKYWTLVIFWMAIIFILSSIPNLKTNLEQDFLLRKIAHIVEFGILTFLLFRALNQEKISFLKKLIFSFIIALFYAFTDELHQYYVIGRHCSFVDVGIDGLGIFIFSLACYYKNRKKVVN